MAMTALAFASNHHILAFTWNRELTLLFAIKFYHLHAFDFTSSILLEKDNYRHSWTFCHQSISKMHIISIQ